MDAGHTTKLVALPQDVFLDLVLVELMLCYVFDLILVIDNFFKKINQLLAR